LAGYAGALAWSALSDDEASDFFACADEITAWGAAQRAPSEKGVDSEPGQA
jgi:hypothetical protein